jgi:hypothetical protein
MPTVATNFAQSTGYAPTSIASLQFEVIADGVNPVTVRFEQVQGNAAILNGFDLTPSVSIAVERTLWGAVTWLYRR